MKFKPNGSWVVLPDPSKTQTDSGIILDKATARAKSTNILEVLAVGPGRISTDGTLIPNRIEVGVTVMVPKFGAQVVVIENETYVVASENDVLGIIKQK